MTVPIYLPRTGLVGARSVPSILTGGPWDTAGYSAKVLATRPANLIAYWPLSEGAGATAYDLSGNGRNGAYTGVDLGQPGIGDGRTAPYFDGVGDFVNLNSASLIGAFNKLEGTMLCWARVSAAAIWADVTARTCFGLGADGANYARIHHNGNGNLSWTYSEAGTARGQGLTGYSSTAWMSLALIWSVTANQVICYYNGAQAGATTACAGSWVGNLAATRQVIGSAITTPVQPWSGWLAHAAVWNVALSPAEIAYLEAP